MRKRILVVAQETALRARIARVLQPAGYAVELAESEKRAFELTLNEHINAAILVPASDLAGLAFARQLSEKIPQLIVLAEGADHIARLGRSLPGVNIQPLLPLDERRLLDRITQFLVDDAVPAPSALRIGDCRIDLAGRTFLKADGCEVALTRAEASLLTTFTRSPGEVLSRDQLSRAIAGHGADPYGRGIDMQIRRLRRKIEADPKLPRLIRTVSGAGYKLAASPQAVEGNRKSPAALEMREKIEADPVQPDGSGPAGVLSQHVRGLGLKLPDSGFERRQLTVLSCELVSSSAPAVDVDPEDFARVIDGFQGACATVIANGGGSIVGFAGHEVLAMFGYPMAHEDDAERAVHAAFDLIAKMGELAWPSREPLQVRMGIATGLAVAAAQGVVGGPLTAAPQLRNTASPNSILVTPITRQLLGRSFVCDHPGSYELAGVSRKIIAFQVTGRRAVASRFSSTRGPRLTKFVGRQHELQRLLTLWEQVKVAEGQVALLCGEAGIGKSRVCEVFLERIIAEPHATLRYQCDPHHANGPFYPIINHFEHEANFKPGDAPEVKLGKLKTVLSEAGAPTPVDIRAFAALLSIPTDDPAASGQTPQQQKDFTIELLIRHILGLARKLPVVVELADAHWADSNTLELFSRMIASIRTAQVFVLANFRPEFFPQWLEEPHVTMLRLDRLGRERTEAIITDIAGDKTLSPEMYAQIVNKTDGVPLFVEELTKSVLESSPFQKTGDQPLTPGLLSLAIPTTLLGSLTARLDRLGPIKEIAQIGATIGREFSYRLLAAVAPMSGSSLDAALAQLVAPELIFVRGESTDSIYVFKHALIRDAAYSTLVRAKRQQLHNRIAHALEEGFPETVETKPELLAHHFIQAGLAERAIAYLHEAGRRAVERSANAEAVRHLTQALELLQSQPESPARAREALGLEVLLSQAMIASYGYAARETAEVLLRAKGNMDDLTDSSQKLAILYGIWAGHYVGGEVAKQTNSAAEFLAEAERHNDTAALCVAHRIMGTTYFTKGSFTPALAHLERARTLFDPRYSAPFQFQYGQDVGAASLCYLSWALWHRGFVDQAFQVATDALKRADELSHPHTQVFTICHARGMIDIFRRQSENMSSYAGSVVSLCQTHGLSHWMAGGRILEGWASLNDRDIDHGIGLIREGIAAWRKAGARLWLPLFLALEAQAYAKADRIEAALQVTEEAIAISENTGENWYLAEILRIKARLLSAVDGAGDQVESLLASSLETARDQQARSWELRTACDLASLWQSKDRSREALHLLQPVYDQFTEGFDTADLRHAKLILNGLRRDGCLERSQPTKRAQTLKRPTRMP